MNERQRWGLYCVPSKSGWSLFWVLPFLVWSASELWASPLHKLSTSDLCGGTAGAALSWDPSSRAPFPLWAAAGRAGEASVPHSHAFSLFPVKVGAAVIVGGESLWEGGQAPIWPWASGSNLLRPSPGFPGAPRCGWVRGSGQGTEVEYQR